MKNLAKIISVVINPFIMPFLGVLLAFKFHEYFAIRYSQHQEFVNTLLFVALILTILFPLLSIFVLYRSKMISDLSLSKKEERLVPMLISVCYYLAYYYFLRKIDGLSSSILAGYLGGCVALIIAAFITPRWKISLHAQGISSLAGMFIGIAQVTSAENTNLILFLFLAIGLVGASRLILNKHKPLQILAGNLLGFLVPYTFVIYNWAV